MIMKKLTVFLLFISLSALVRADFYVLVNGTDYYLADETGQVDFQNRTQYMAACVPLHAGDVIKCYDTSSKTAWAINALDPYGEHAKFTCSASGLTCNTAGSYDIYIKMKMNDDIWYVGAGDAGCTPMQPSDPNAGTTGGGTNPPAQYATAVPAQSGDVMLQAFYWESSTDKGFGSTSWTALKSHTQEIGQYFDLVWLAPSAKANDKMGYLPNTYSSQSNSMGQKSVLMALIQQFHQSGVKVLADIVINHSANRSSWCDFNENDFGSYGKFQPQTSWICSSDEAFTGSHCSGGGQTDDGQDAADKNYPSARDWDHKNPQVQAMMKAYLQWLKSDIGYDGFRYDYSKGYHVSHVNDYNAVAKPYISVMEYWNGDPLTLKTRVDEAGRNTMTFDFANYYTALRDGLGKSNYNNLRAAGLRSRGYEKYAVTFVDNHDTFGRSDSQDVLGKKDGSSVSNRDMMLQMNAYILSMPGIPCVFWPHWVTYKDEIKQMIHARKMAGVHSESAVTEQSGSGWYKATVQGKAGQLILYLGTAASEQAPAGYTEALKTGKVAVYYTGSGLGWENCEQHPAARKLLRDGRLVIQVGDTSYDVLGHQL